MQTWADDSEIAAIVKSQKAIGGKTIEMAYSPHFAVLMDHRSLKIKTKGGSEALNAYRRNLRVPLYERAGRVVITAE